MLATTEVGKLKRKAHLSELAGTRLKLSYGPPSTENAPEGQPAPQPEPRPLETVGAHPATARSTRLSQLSGLKFSYEPSQQAQTPAPAPVTLPSPATSLAKLNLRFEQPPPAQPPAVAPMSAPPRPPKPVYRYEEMRPQLETEPPRPSFQPKRSGIGARLLAQMGAAAQAGHGGDPTARGFNAIGGLIGGIANPEHAQEAAFLAGPVALWQRLVADVRAKNREKMKVWESEIGLRERFEKLNAAGRPKLKPFPGMPMGTLYDEATGDAQQLQLDGQPLPTASELKRRAGAQQFQFNPQTGTFYRTLPDGTLDYQTVDVPYTLPAGAKRFQGDKVIAEVPPVARQTGAPKPPTAPKYSLTDAQQEQLAEDGSVEGIVEAGLQKRIPAIEAALPPGTLQILRTDKKSKAMRDPATGKTVMIEVAATPQEFAAARKLRDDAIEKERKKMLIETRGVAQTKAAQRYLNNRNGATAAAGAPGYGEAQTGTPDSSLDDALFERTQTIEAALPGDTMEMIWTGRKTVRRRDPATGREVEFMTKATKAEIAAAQKLRDDAIERERQKLLAERRGATTRQPNQRNSGGRAASKPDNDELNRYAEWLRGKGLSEVEIQQRLQQHR